MEKQKIPKDFKFTYCIVTCSSSLEIAKQITLNDSFPLFKKKENLIFTYYPSRPLIPTPTCAALIIFTSLAPSPIASVETSGLASLTNVTICYFCFGETLQQSTEEQLFVIAIINDLGPSIIAWINASPVIINALFVLGLLNASTFFSMEFLTYRSCFRISFRHSSSVRLFLVFMMYYLRSLESNLHEKPMLIAVSTLSPVRTHTYFYCKKQNK